MGKVLALLVLLLAAAGAAWHFAGQADPPSIEIVQPARLVGRQGSLEVLITTPKGALTRFEVALQQGDERLPLVSHAGPDIPDLELVAEDRLRYARAIGKEDVPALQAGPLTVIVSAARPVLFGLREIPAAATRTVEVRLTPPVIGVASRFHYINHGGSEMVVYRVRPGDVESGVRVGDIEYPGYPAAGAGIEGADPGLRVAFFALLWNQEPNTPITLYARDEVGNEARASFDHRVFPKTFRTSRITLDDRFLQKVVPEILYNTPELAVENPNDLLASYLRINGELRRMNNAQIADLATRTAPQILWRGPFEQLVNTAVEAGFADQRT